MDTKLLEDIGLTKSEVDVYLALLEIGSSSTGKIVEKSKASSSKIYEILDRLMQKGMASSVIKGGVKHFDAAPPERILDYVAEKEKNVQEQKEGLKKLIPELKLKKTLAKHASEATIYKGLRGVETAFFSALELMKKGDEYLSMGIPTRTLEFNRMILKFEQERNRRGVRCRAIVNDSAREDIQIKNHVFTALKFTPEITPTAINLFKNRVLICPESKEPLLISIDSKEVADSFRVQFEMWWNQEVSVTKGFPAFDSALTHLLDDAGKEGLMALGATFGTTGKDTIYADFFRKFHLDKRIPRKIPYRLLFKQGTEQIIEKYGKSYPTASYGGLYATYKMLPDKTYSPVETFIGKTQSLIVIQEPEPTVITIRNTRVAQDFKTTFDSMWNQDTVVLKGLDAVQQCFEEMLEAGSCDYIGARGYFFDRRPAYTKDWERRAKESGFKMRNITDPGVRGHPITLPSFVETKYTLPKEFANLSVFWIYAEKVVITNWVQEEPLCIVINKKEMHDLYKTQFELLWNKKIA